MTFVIYRIHLSHFNYKSPFPVAGQGTANRKYMQRIYFVCVLVLHGISAVSQKPITGFADEAAAEHFRLEQEFDGALSRESIRNTIREFSSRPHHLGSPGSKAVADSAVNRFRAYGWDVRLDTYHVLFPTPKERVLEMIAPVKYAATLKEPGLKEDRFSRQQGQLPTYNAWSADGDVIGELVFVNYGLPEDYEILERLGVDVKGKIVIAKYGRSWRGIKPKVALEHGAIGCIIYSDPADDGYRAGDVYPKGAFKNEHGVQRGSVMDMPVYPGDPLTPMRGATREAERISRNDAPNLIKIPVLPISYHDAEPLLSALGGPVAPRGWEGALPITYHVGPGAARVRLKLSFNWDIVPCYNVIATVPGSRFPDEWIVRGNHHDAWVNGATDPISGVACLLEEARSIGALLKKGWRPKRTLVYCLWDGEEPGLIGSTEFVENHLDELRNKAVVYINTDDNGRGFLGAGGSHSLQTLINEVARDVIDPQTNASVQQRLLAWQAVHAPTVSAKKRALEKSTLELYPLGSGSDYSPFLQHAGIPSLNLSYSGEDGGGEYHSIYDTYDHYARFKDPSFAYGVTLAQTVGRSVLRLSEAERLPFDFDKLLNAIREYANEVIELAETRRQEASLDVRLRATNAYSMARDTAQGLDIPKPIPTVPYLDFSPLQNALSALEGSVEKLQASMANVRSKPLLASLNSVLYKAEQQLLLPEGLPRREWYMHSIYAPGFYSGYGVKTLPAIREAIEQGEWHEAEEGIRRSAAAVRRLSDHLETALP